MQANKTNKSNKNFSKNKENQSFITYKSLNQRIIGQSKSKASQHKSKLGHPISKNPVFKTKVISQKKFRTKQNSPTRRDPSLEKDSLKSHQEPEMYFIHKSQPSESKVTQSSQKVQNSLKMLKITNKSSNNFTADPQKEINFNEMRNNFIHNLELQESALKDRYNRQNELQGRNTSPPVIGDEHKPLKLLHYHKKNNSGCQNKPIVACALSKYGKKFMRQSLDSNDEKESYHDLRASTNENLNDDYKSANSAYHKRRVSNKIWPTKNLTQANSPKQYFHQTPTYEENIHNFKTHEYKSRERKAGRSKSNSLNPQKSHTERNKWDNITSGQMPLPQSLTEVQLVKEFRDFTDLHENGNSKLYRRPESYNGSYKYSTENLTNDQSIVKSRINPLKNNIQQSNEKIKSTHEERYEGSARSIEETPYYANNFENTTEEKEKSDSHSSLNANEENSHNFIPFKDFDEGDHDHQILAHATFDKTGFCNPPTVYNSKNPSHNTSVETVVNQQKTVPPPTFLGVIQEAIKTFSKVPTSKQVFEMKPKPETSGRLQELLEENYELREDNQTLVEENDSLKEELQMKDNTIRELNEKLRNVRISLKECEIRLSHTTQMYAKERDEKENIYIAFNRILSNFTENEDNSQKFLQQNLLYGKSKNQSRLVERPSSSEDYSSNLGRYPEEDESY